MTGPEFFVGVAQQVLLWTSVGTQQSRQEMTPFSGSSYGTNERSPVCQYTDYGMYWVER